MTSGAIGLDFPIYKRYTPLQGSIVSTYFDSMYESFQALTSIQVSHFVEWFSGSALPNYWTFTNTVGSGSATMYDSIDGGLRISSGSNANDRCTIHFNTKRHYDEDNCEMIAVSNWVNVGAWSVGFSNDTDLASSFSTYNMGSFYTYIQLYTRDGTTPSATNSSISRDTAQHSMKLNLNSTNNLLYIDGVLEVTKTTNLPIVPLQPVAKCYCDAVGGNTSDIQYLECYNTSISINSSIYERLSALTQVLKQRSVTSFVGNSLPDGWTTNIIAGSGTISMDDSVDGGLKSVTGSTVSNRQEIQFNGKRQYDNDNSVIIGVIKASQLTNTQMEVGFLDGATYSRTVRMGFVSASTNYRLTTGDGTESSTEGSVAKDTSWHNHKADLNGINVKYYMDGVLDVTKTTNYPDQRLQPWFFLNNSPTGGSTKQANIRYYEAYNKLGTEGDYSSVYELFNPLTTVAKAHFWDWFDGNGLDTNRWVTEDSTGSPTYEMVDSVDGGFKIVCSTNTWRGLIYLSKRQFSYDSCEFIFVGKRDTSNTQWIVGLYGSTSGSIGSTSAVYFGDDTGASNKYIGSNDGSSSSTTTLSALDTTIHSYKATIGASNILAYVDGVLGATHTTNLPTTKLTPIMQVRSRGSGTKSGSINYLEVKNT